MHFDAINVGTDQAGPSLAARLTARQPGRVAGNVTTFPAPGELATAMPLASVAHGEHEKRNGGQYDVHWPDWYAEFMVQEQAGKPLPL